MAITLKKLLKKERRPERVGTTDLVSSYLRALHSRECKKSGVDVLFTLGGEPVEGANIAMADCLMPVFAWHANALYKSAFNHPMGILLTDSSEAFLGKQVDMDGVNVNTSTLLLFLTDAFYDAKDNLELSTSHPGAMEIGRLVSRFNREFSNKIRANEKEMSQ